MNIRSASQTNQELLANVLRDLFPRELTVIDSKKQSSLKYNNGAYVELDIWIPKFNMCFEFQDAYHYTTTWYSQKPLNKVQLVDTYKRTKVHKAGMDLVVVPCWWDGSAERLLGTIYFQRPDMLYNLETWHHPIPLNPPLDFFPEAEIPLIGELMLAKFPDYSKSLPVPFPTSWWIGEKYDGFRCCWIPDKNQLYSRTGRVITLLPELTLLLVTTHIQIDAEMWFGRGNFKYIHSIVNQLPSVAWHALRMNAFDVPLRCNQLLFFEQRYALLLSHTYFCLPFVNVVTRLQDEQKGELSGVLRMILDQGGEGLILQQPSSLYVHGRSPSLLKVKGSQEDKEAVVVAKGVKSVVLKMPSGSIFSVPISNVLVPNVEIGEVVTFSYERYGHKEFFVNPTVHRVRSDVSWDDVVQNSKTEQHALLPTTEHQAYVTEATRNTPITNQHNSSKMKFQAPNTSTTELTKLLDKTTRYQPAINNITLRKRTNKTHQQSAVHYKKRPTTSKPKKTAQRRWTNQSMRLFLEDIAHKNHPSHQSIQNGLLNLDSDTIRREGGKTILEYFKGYPGTMKSLFPEVGFDTDRFELGSIAARRNLLERFAQVHGFDPKIPENWYHQPKEKMMAFEGIPSIMRLYKENIPKALLCIFPDIGLDKSKFVGNLEQQRSFFEKYARDNGFDFRNPNNWYKLSSKQIMATKGALGVLHNYSIVGVLCSVFPEIVGLDEYEFRKQRQLAKQRDVFECFAAENAFDPYNASNWANQPREKLLQFKGIQTVIKRHKNKLATALIRAFPGIGLEDVRLRRLDRHVHS